MQSKLATLAAICSVSFVSVYNPPDHVQQPTVYSSSGPSSYTSWSTIQPQTPSTTIVSPAINCWSLTSSPPPPHQISAQTTPSQSPSHQLYQHTPISNLTNLSYPSYYNQDLSYTHYQNPEYIPLINSNEVTYSQLGNERSTPAVYHEEVANLEKVSEYEQESTPAQNQPESPGSNSSTPRHDWVPVTHSHI